jgi:hypothetical protein
VIPPALIQLVGARAPAPCLPVYVALHAQLDPGEYRAPRMPELVNASGVALSTVYASLSWLADHGFLDARGPDRGPTPRKFRLLLSQRVGVSHAAA